MYKGSYLSDQGVWERCDCYLIGEGEFGSVYKGNYLSNLGVWERCNCYFIGEGEFGSVYKGSYLSDQGVVKEVAVKALSKETIEPHQVIKHYDIYQNLLYTC